MSGYVYLVTSPAMNAVKIGGWSGSLHDLRQRYATPYGPDVAICARFVTQWFRELLNTTFAPGMVSPVRLP